MKILQEVNCFNLLIIVAYVYRVSNIFFGHADSFSSTMDSGSYVMDNSSLLAPPPRFPFSMTTSRHSLPNLDPNDMVVSSKDTEKTSAAIGGHMT